LRDAINWSYELLSEEEKPVFERLGVFAGGCTLDAARVVAGGEHNNVEVQSTLSSLVAKSLLRHEKGQEGDLRYGMLETIREYALEKLRERDEEQQCRRRHAVITWRSCRKGMYIYAALVRANGSRSWKQSTIICVRHLTGLSRRVR
jgi:predicted ATPase